MLRFIINTIVVGICTYLITYFGEEKHFMLLALPISALAILSIANFHLSGREDPLMWALLRLLYEQLPISPEAKVRITVLRPSPFTRNFLQVIRYSIAAPQLTNHRFHIEKGVAGIAYRTAEPAYLTIESTFHRDIMFKLGFTDDEARKFIQKAEYFCIPIRDLSKRVCYVISLDSEIRGVLNDTVQKKVLEFAPYFASLLLRVFDEPRFNELASLNRS